MRRSQSKPAARRPGPVTSSASASSRLITPTPIVRSRKISLSVNSVSYSSMCAGKARMKASAFAVQPSGRSAIRPPGRMKLVIRRAPLIISKRSSSTSRSRKQYKNALIAPRSSACVPSQTRWLLMRVNSASSTRMTVARSGISTPSSFSTARA